MSTAHENLQKAINKMSFLASVMDEDNLKTMKSDAYVGLQNEAWALVELLKVTNAQFDAMQTLSSEGITLCNARYSL